MNPKELAKAIIANSDANPQNLETFKQKVKTAVVEQAVPDEALRNELLESEEKFHKTIAEIIDIKWDSGLIDVIDNLLILAVVKAALGKLDAYNELKK